MFRFPAFFPARFLRNRHLMTLVPRYWSRGRLLTGIPSERRFFRTAPETQLLGFCHWQPHRRTVQTALLLHGLEGCSDSHYIHGIAAKAYAAGLNVVRINQRTCGGTEHLSPTLYNSGLSADYRSVVRQLAETEELNRIWLIGYSMGGNLLLKATGEMGTDEPALAGTVVVCPNIDPSRCVIELERPGNWLYHRHFLTGLKARVRRQAALMPGKWDLTGLNRITRISEFDDRYTAPDGGYANAADYYDRSGARHVLNRIAVPTTIITAQDDPFIPYSMFITPLIQQHASIRLIAPVHGGHCGFFQTRQAQEDRYWVENRIIEIVTGAW
ncbi:MAG TPA: alpha/beta fold hydrolase [Nitrospira sp.]|nr:alpha/beta fold hydrolase [Nitrospira sp.]